MDTALSMGMDMKDTKTAEAFSDSWNNCFSGSPYTLAQVREWFSPLDMEELAGRKVCEMGCGNGGLLQYVARFSQSVTGVELGRCVNVARENFRRMKLDHVVFARQDIPSFAATHRGAYDFVYCIGVLHHMQDPRQGFEAVVRATRPGGRFHCWVYGYEGNALIRTAVEPLRRLASRLPWWLNKYGLALPLAVPFFLASQGVKRLPRTPFTRLGPLAGYLRWIADYRFAFHHHVAFDQLVSPRTVYLRRETIAAWLARLDLEKTYLLPRNGNSWTFGGVKRA
jgi:SAM-dependent methyltransferase